MLEGWPPLKVRFLMPNKVLDSKKSCRSDLKWLYFGHEIWKILQDTLHRWPEQEGGLTDWTKRSDTIRVAGATPLTTPNVCTNHRIRVFWENQFFGFWGAPKNFFKPLKPYLASETSLFGGHTSNILWSEHRFRSWKFNVLAPSAPEISGTIARINEC